MFLLHQRLCLYVKTVAGMTIRHGSDSELCPDFEIGTPTNAIVGRRFGKCIFKVKAGETFIQCFEGK